MDGLVGSDDVGRLIKGRWEWTRTSVGLIRVYQTKGSHPRRPKVCMKHHQADIMSVELIAECSVTQKLRVTFSQSHVSVAHSIMLGLSKIKGNIGPISFQYVAQEMMLGQSETQGKIGPILE